MMIFRRYSTRGRNENGTDRLPASKRMSVWWWRIETKNPKSTWRSAIQLERFRHKYWNKTMFFPEGQSKTFQFSFVKISFKWRSAVPRERCPKDIPGSLVRKNSAWNGRWRMIISQEGPLVEKRETEVVECGCSDRVGALWRFHLVCPNTL